MDKIIVSQFKIINLTSVDTTKYVPNVLLSFEDLFEKYYKLV